MRFLFNDEMYDPVNITSNFGSNFPRSIYFDFLIWDKRGGGPQNVLLSGKFKQCLNIT